MICNLPGSICRISLLTYVFVLVTYVVGILSISFSILVVLVEGQKTGHPLLEARLEFRIFCALHSRCGLLTQERAFLAI